MILFRETQSRKLMTIQFHHKTSKIKWKKTDCIDSGCSQCTWRKLIVVERFKFSHSVYAHNNGFLLTPQKSLRYERIILEPTERGKMPSGSSFIS